MNYQWIDINEYSRFFGVSISTIRRKINSGQLNFKKEKRKYLIRVLSEKFKTRSPLELENEQLKRKMQFLEQEIQDFKMLIKIYEKEIK